MTVMLSNFRKLALAGTCLACMSGAAIAADYDPEPTYTPTTLSGWYIRGDIGFAISDINVGGVDEEDAPAVGFGLGYRFNEMFRADVTFDGAFDYDFGSGVDSYGVLANVYLDVPIDFIVTPYVGGGIGWGEVSGNGIDDDGISFATMAGFSFDMSQSIVLDIGYKFRYTDLSQAKTGLDYWAEHMFRAGVRIGF